MAYVRSPSRWKLTTPRGRQRMADAEQSEAQFERAVRELAEHCGWLVHHPWSSKRSTAGWPDLAMARDRRLVLAELKTEKGRVSREQRAWLDALGEFDDRDMLAASLNGSLPRLMVCLWRPSDWEFIRGVLR
jgi:hypothetical protein